MKGDSNFVGGMYVSATALDKLQRKFGTEPTKPGHYPDPMAGKPMLATKGCPCDDCEHRTVCRAECRAFGVWVERGRPVKRRYLRSQGPVPPEHAPGVPS